MNTKLISFCNPVKTKGRRHIRDSKGLVCWGKCMDLWQEASRD